jgi:hypothetical protein
MIALKKAFSLNHCLPPKNYWCGASRRTINSWILRLGFKNRKWLSHFLFLYKA